MNSNSNIKSMEAEILKNADMKIKKIQAEQKLKAEVKNNSTNIVYSEKDLNGYVSDKSITILISLIILAYIFIFKKKNILSKIIMYILLFVVLNNFATIILLKFNPHPLFKEAIGLIPILLIIWLSINKLKKRKVVQNER